MTSATSRTALGHSDAALSQRPRLNRLRLRRPAEGRAQRPPDRRPPLVVVNPLSAALRHYESEIVSLVGDAETAPLSLTTAEPSVDGRHRLRWLVSYLILLLRAGRRARSRARCKVLVIWPVVGYWDLVLIRLIVGRSGTLVIHDPVPLVRARGYGAVARWAGVHLGGGVRIIVHSRVAADALDPRLRSESVDLLPHPMLVPDSGRDGGADRRRPIVRIVGQYKAHRDLEALRLVAEQLGDTRVLEIHGRGWPDVPGWLVRDAFVPEQELDRLIASSDAVLIPYRRFFQSGIAMRCLEHGTPVVGPRDSSLSEVFGRHSHLLVDGHDDWSRAIDHATSEGISETRKAAARWRSTCERTWKAWRNGPAPA
ncbi:hypothetical protein [Geodermatophilus sp. CPCC 205761]|uniref:hypothetical protein n=1 Tax=Geodermatophilus sp. CPCC 205761 TaxID=2936597 RepID=UPI003EEA24CE